MLKINDTFRLSASDLVGHLNCRNLTELDVAVAKGRLAKPKSCTRSLRGGREGRDGVNCGVHTKDAIHPGMHSSDIYCSMAVSVFADTNPTEMLDAGMKYSHMATCRSLATCRSYGAIYAQGFELLPSDTPHLVLVID